METTTRMLDLDDGLRSDGQQTDRESGAEVAVPADSEDERRRILLYQYERCCDDWRHHDAIIWEMPVATLTASAVIVWAATAGSETWVLSMAWGLAAVICAVMSMGLRKQVQYARQISKRIREIEDEFQMPRVTAQVGPRGLISTLMVWTLRLAALTNLIIAVLTAVRPGLLF
jgi:hypothetical protein